MRTIPVFDGTNGLVSCHPSGSVKLLYMTHLALGDYVYQGPFLKALALSQPNIQLIFGLMIVAKKRNLGMPAEVNHLCNGCPMNRILILYTLLPATHRI